MSDLVTVDHQDNVLILTLNRPERKNALSTELLDVLRDALNSEINDETIAIILHGAGGCLSGGGADDRWDEEPSALCGGDGGSGGGDASGDRWGDGEIGRGVAEVHRIGGNGAGGVGAGDGTHEGPLFEIPEVILPDRRIPVSDLTQAVVLPVQRLDRR